MTCETRKLLKATQKVEVLDEILNVRQIEEQYEQREIGGYSELVNMDLS